jgi:hypothetical protein
VSFVVLASSDFSNAQDVSFDELCLERFLRKSLLLWVESLVFLEGVEIGVDSGEMPFNSRKAVTSWELPECEKRYRSSPVLTFDFSIELAAYEIYQNNYTLWSSL